MRQRLSMAWPTTSSSARIEASPSAAARCAVHGAVPPQEGESKEKPGGCARVRAPSPRTHIVTTRTQHRHSARDAAISVRVPRAGGPPPCVVVAPRARCWYAGIQELRVSTLLGRELSVYGCEEGARVISSGIYAAGVSWWFAALYQGQGAVHWQLGSSKKRIPITECSVQSPGRED